MKAKFYLAAAGLCVLLLTGCATNYVSQFYRDRTTGALADRSAMHLAPFSGATQIYSTSSHRADGAELVRRGYVLIGESSFDGTAMDEKQIKRHAKRVGADVVLYSCQHIGSSQAAVPLMQFNTGGVSTTYSSGTVNATAYGNRGPTHGTATYSGTATTVSPGTYSTTVLPITVHRYSNTATFWRKAK